MPSGDTAGLPSSPVSSVICTGALPAGERSRRQMDFVPLRVDSNTNPLPSGSQ
ncbi:MAG: hypothetical protein IPI48_10770 [bacterium]|nr:hypothetical protein [bacterium]